MANSSGAFFDEIDQNMGFPFTPSFPSAYDMMPLPSSSDDPWNFGFSSDMLDVSDYLFDGSQNIGATSASNVPVNVEMMNTLVTPNYSWNGATAATGYENVGMDVTDAGKGENHHQHKTNKELMMPKKKYYQKKERGPSVAFITKSEEDYIDDGYKWRKYGQKDLKRSPHPRSYYRCMAEGCNVKKHVERYWKDPSMVMTTYEGQHTHACPATSLYRLDTSGFGHKSKLASPHTVLQQQEQLQQQPQPLLQPFWEQKQNVEYHAQAGTMLHNSTSSLSPLNDVNSASPVNYPNTWSLSFLDQNNEDQPGFVHSSTVVPPVDDLSFNNSGLLQDIVPMHVRYGDNGNHV